jgi:asparagine synthase (glutamine-hydrolysing)
VSDFLLDFRDLETRRLSASKARSLLQFCDDTQVIAFETPAFSLVLARVDDLELWGPYDRSAAGDLLVALAGWVAFEPRQWDEARMAAGKGGLACKAIAEAYRRNGVGALEALNGNFAAIVYDPRESLLHLITDRCGMFLAYTSAGEEKRVVYGSHPDVLASVLGESQNWDTTSLAEFLMTSRLTFPYTYYRNIRGLEPGHIRSFSLKSSPVKVQSNRRYFEFGFQVDPKVGEWELAEELSSAWKRAVTKRTLPSLGTTGVALSGGLDSRALLAAAGTGEHLRAFTLFDEENAEFRIARSIAEACGVRMLPIRRDPEFYGNSAELGVRISGGTGAVSCNHMLGARTQLREFGIQSILTGCYCDYLLKGLALNTVENKLTGTQRLAGFRFPFYDRHSEIEPSCQEKVQARLQAFFPESTQTRLSEEDWFNIQRKRCFPLAYEQDSAQRVIPQRVMPWFLPIVDNDIIACYLRIPSRYKLNASLFKKTLTLLCPQEVCRIRDSNTGIPMKASRTRQVLHRCCATVVNRVEAKLRKRLATRGSWPDLHRYFRHSKVVESQWRRPNPAARESFTAILGQNPFEESMGQHAAENPALCFNLWTQKIWLDQRM